MSIFDKDFIIMTFDLETDDIIPLMELEWNSAFCTDFEEWSDTTGRHDFEDLEEYALHWFMYRKIN